MACSAAALLLSLEARADERWLSFAGSARCSDDRVELASRIREAVIGLQDPELHADVTILDAEHTTTAIVRLTLGSRVVGTKRLVAPTCGEALDAALAVVALALSSEPAAVRPRSEPAAARPRSAAPLLDVPSPTVESQAMDRGTREGERRLAPNRWRLLLGGGVDLGALPKPTVVVGAGAAARIGRGELRAIGWYGLPSTEEEESASFESTRSDFVAVGLDYCHGLDPERWLALCGGMQLGLARLLRIEQSQDQPRTERERIEGELGAVMSVALTYRDAPVMPRLDVSGRLPIAGGLADGHSIGFRAAFGVAVPF